MIDVVVIGGVFREVIVGDSSRHVRYGGSGLVAAIAAARLNIEVALVGCVGAEDEEAIRCELRAAGVDDEAIVPLGGASGTFMFPVEESLEKPWPMYRPAEAISHRSRRVPQASVVLAFGIPDYDPIDQGWLDSMRSDATLIWDRQGWLSRARGSDAILPLRAATKIYLANEAEAIEDAAVNGIAQMRMRQPPEGFAISLIKRGAAGVEVFVRNGTKSRREIVPAYRVDAKSTIGSGDVFAGAFAARIAAGDAPATAAKWGCAAAATALRVGNNLLRERDAGAIAGLVCSGRFST